MNNEHARAKDAYDKIEKAVEVRVEAPGVTKVPEGASSLMWPENGKLVCSRPITQEEAERLKKLDQEAPQDDVNKVLEEQMELLRKNAPKSPWETALKKVQDAYGKEAFTTLNTWALKVPSMLQSQGLLQTVAILQEKFNGKAADGKNVYWLLSEWLLAHVPWPTGVKQKDLMATLNALGDQEVFRFAHREAIAYMIWVKRAVSVKLAGIGQGG